MLKKEDGMTNGTIARIETLIKFAFFFTRDANHEHIQGPAFQS